jgi:hypothetical protein
VEALVIDRRILPEPIFSFMDAERVRVEKEADRVVLTPAEEREVKPVFGCAKGQFWMADDFDAPLDCFKEYM